MINGKNGEVISTEQWKKTQINKKEDMAMENSYSIFHCHPA